MNLALDIFNEIEDRLSWPQSTTLEDPDPSPEQRKLLRLFNRVLSSWAGLDDWNLLRKDGDLVLVPVEESDTTEGSEQYVTATENSDTITIANITLDKSYIGRAIKVSSEDYVYRIIAVPTTTSLQLNRAWVGDSITVADEATFIIGTDRYALPTDFDRPTESLESFLAPYNIEPVSPREFSQRRRGQGITSGEPQVYTIYGLNDAETAQLVHFDPYPETARLLNYPYQRKHKKIDSDNDKLFIQDRYIEAFIDMVLQLALRDYEDDDKMQATLADMIRNFNVQRSNQEPTEARLVMRPRNRTRADIRRAASLSGHRIDYKDYFDNVDNTGLS